jgi:hypothetical protein
MNDPLIDQALDEAEEQSQREKGTPMTQTKKSSLFKELSSVPEKPRSPSQLERLELLEQSHQQDRQTIADYQRTLANYQATCEQQQRVIKQQDAALAVVLPRLHETRRSMEKVSRDLHNRKALRFLDYTLASLFSLAVTYLFFAFVLPLLQRFALWLWGLF